MRHSELTRDMGCRPEDLPVYRMTPDREYIRRKLSEVLERLIDYLRVEDRRIPEILRMRFQLYGGARGELKELADRFGLTTECIRQIEARGIRFLQCPWRCDKLVYRYTGDDGRGPDVQWASTGNRLSGRRRTYFYSNGWEPSREAGFGRHTGSGVRGRWGILPRVEDMRTDWDEVVDCALMYDRGLTNVEIGERLGMTQHQVRYRLTMAANCLYERLTNGLKNLIKNRKAGERMKLISMKLKNFKGIRKYEAQLDGHDAVVLADNGVGKTTLKDAFLWLFTDKDSRNNQLGRNVKPTDETGREKHGLVSSVEVELDTEDGGPTLTLKKEYEEKWTKKTGDTSETLTGHTTNYYIDGVETGTKREFDETVEELVPQDLFPVLSDPECFADTMHWSDRREILMDLVEGVSVAQVVEANDELEDLPEILDGREPGEYKKIAKARLKEANDNIDGIPDRIDEAHKAMSDVDKSMDELQDEKKELQGELRDLREQKQSGTDSTRIAEIKAEIRDVESRIKSARQDAERAARRKRDDIDDKIRALRRDARNTREDIESVEEQVSDAEKTIEKLKSERDSLRDKWHEVDKRRKRRANSTFEYEPDQTCPTCGQDLPEDQIESARQEAEAQFNERKADDLQDFDRQLEEIEKAGKAKKGKQEKVEKDLEGYRSRLESLRDELPDDLDQRIQDLKDQKEQIEADTSEVEPLETELAELEGKLGAARRGEPDEDADKALDEKIESVEEEIEEVSNKISQIETNRRQEERIEELKQREKELAKQAETCQGHLHLLDEFTKTKVDMIENSINAKFDLASFKLFEVQVNGAINDVCEVMYEGVPFTTNLNHAAQICVGLDIIDTLSDYHGVELPVFVDHSESINDNNFPDVDMQLIKLRFDPDYGNLTTKEA